MLHIEGIKLFVEWNGGQASFFLSEKISQYTLVLLIIQENEDKATYKQTKS